MDKIIALVKDWRNALAVLLIAGLALWINPDAKGFLALALLVFAAVYLVAAVAKRLGPKPPPAPPGQDKPSDA